MTLGSYHTKFDFYICKTDQIKASLVCGEILFKSHKSLQIIKCHCRLLIFNEKSNVQWQSGLIQDDYRLNGLSWQQTQHDIQKKCAIGDIITCLGWKLSQIKKASDSLMQFHLDIKRIVTLTLSLAEALQVGEKNIFNKFWVYLRSYLVGMQHYLMHTGG